jgi:2-C-methyl-D-erythritol 4-phosphate cytidylyltransferase
MKTDVFKQFLELCGKPILMHTILVFAENCEGTYPIVVLPPSQIDYWHKLCDTHGFTQPHKVVAGGSTRFQSVKNGLMLLPNNGLVAIHDGVRPLVSRQTIINCFRNASNYGCAVPTIPVVDSVREITSHSSKMLDRSKMRLIQTPQVFEVAKLKKAYEQKYSPTFTDDAAVYESAGHAIHLTEGNVENIKITTQNDLIIAEAFGLK